MSRTTRAAALMLVSVVSIAGCSAGCSANPADLPIPGSYVEGDEYTVDIEFASVLNLPTKAKVIVDGVQAGVLDHVTLVDDRAIATVDLAANVSLPRDTVAELRQSTILGEIYISLQPPTDPSSNAVLSDGDVIPLDHTVPADNVEDVLRGLSNVVTGGHVVELQEAVNNVNAAVPQDPLVFDRVNTAARAAISDLGANTADIDRILAAAEGVSNTLVAQESGLTRVLDLGPSRAEGLSEVLFSVVNLIFALGYMSQHVGDVLGPPYEELGGAIGIILPAIMTVSRADTTVPMNVAKVDALLRDRLVPFFSATPNIRIASVSGPNDPGARADEMIGVLRSIGIVR
ncbi:MlaD family protein [Rhodococcus sp. IEGM 1354]|uniref:MlaD family protein n=1 Tax=Rhodococcus sp. IEGM 1354 TaxID=3047088 RepID=UPI0024B6E50E|nr:MlaD family protein [Rhodococcus sp. IEGM 1354]MDI9932676.1 MlaD family protein [Rhodococcus sp. IEGM 1354]